MYNQDTWSITKSEEVYLKFTTSCTTRKCSIAYLLYLYLLSTACYFISILIKSVIPFTSDSLAKLLCMKTHWTHLCLWESTATLIFHVCFGTALSYIDMSWFKWAKCSFVWKNDWNWWHFNLVVYLRSNTTKVMLQKTHNAQRGVHNRILDGTSGSLNRRTQSRGQLLPQSLFIFDEARFDRHSPAHTVVVYKRN